MAENCVASSAINGDVDTLETSVSTMVDFVPDAIGIVSGTINLTYGVAGNAERDSQTKQSISDAIIAGIEIIELCKQLPSMIKQSGFEIVKDAVIFAYESLDNLKLDIESLVPMCKQGADSIKLITNGNELLDMIRHPKLANIIPDATESIKQAHAYSFATKTDPALTGYKKNKVGALDTQNIAMSTMVSSGSIARIDTIIKYGTDMKAKSNSLKIMNMSDYACNGGQN